MDFFRFGSNYCWFRMLGKVRKTNAMVLMMSAVSVGSGAVTGR